MHVKLVVCRSCGTYLCIKFIRNYILTQYVEVPMAKDVEEIFILFFLNRGTSLRRAVTHILQMLILFVYNTITFFTTPNYLTDFHNHFREYLTEHLIVETYLFSAKLASK